jgi:AcrR family transcriptional regulator
VAADDVPIELKRLWRLTTRSRTGRPAELDVELIVRTAVDLADRDGVAGVSMTKVANRLGVTAMALYTHVGSKEHLLELMQDLASGLPPKPDPEQDWRDGLTVWAQALRRMYDAHPWLAELPIHGPPLGPHQVAWMEAALQVLEPTGLEWGEKLNTINLLAGYVLHSSRQAIDLAAGRQARKVDRVRDERAYGRALGKLIDRDRFPQMNALLTSGLFERTAPPPSDPAEDPDFRFGLDRLLDGIAKLCQSRQSEA